MLATKHDRIPWPRPADYNAERERIFQAHVKLYVREGRRLPGDYVLTEHDCLGTTVVEDSVGLGSFIMDSHIGARRNHRGPTQPGR